MPVKKNNNKKISKEQRESIKQAVNSLSGLVQNTQAPKEQPKENPEPSQKKFPASKYHNTVLDQKKRRIVWTAVTLLMIIIFGFWTYTVRLQVKTSGFGTGSDGILWETAKINYDEILKTVKTDEPKTSSTPDPVTYEDSEKIKEILKQNIIIFEQTSTSTTSTSETSTSTPAQINTTTEKIVTTTKK